MDIAKLYENLRVEDPSKFPDNAEKSWSVQNLGAVEENALDLKKGDGIEAEVGTINKVSGKAVTSIFWNIPARTNRGLSPLLLNGSIFNPRGMSFSITDIFWKAGGGWPWYTVPQPRSDTQSDMLFPNAPAHSIIAFVGCVRWQVPNVSGQASGTGNCQCAWGVNDQPNAYGDNEGGYRLWLHGYW